MPKLSRPVIYTALGAVVVAAFVLTGEEPKKSSSTKVRAQKPTVAKRAQSEFLPEDYEKQNFQPIVIVAPNKFEPLVQKTKTSMDYALAPDSVPSELAGGDPNWIYTGTAEVDGKPTALIENRVTGESEFINQGQKWKRATVSQILPQGLILAGPSGKKVKLTLSNGDSTILPGSARYANGFQPVNPGGLRGPIGGNGISVRPDRSAARGNGVEARDAN